MIPQSFEQWKDCIENKCKIKLTPSYIEGRINELSNESHPTTQIFIKLYGQEHKNNTLNWFIVSLRSQN